MGATAGTSPRAPLHGQNRAFSAGDLNDLHAYDPVARAWTNLSTPAAGAAPSRRDSHGFTPAGGVLYVHAGQGPDGMLISYGSVGPQVPDRICPTPPPPPPLRLFITRPACPLPLVPELATHMVQMMFPVSDRMF